MYDKQDPGKDWHNPKEFRRIGDDHVDSTAINETKTQSEIPKWITFSVAMVFLFIATYIVALKTINPDGDIPHNGAHVSQNPS
jgi:hypothetical protein